MIHRLRSKIDFRRFRFCTDAAHRFAVSHSSIRDFGDTSRKFLLVARMCGLALSLLFTSHHVLAASTAYQLQPTKAAPKHGGPARKILARQVGQLKTANLLHVHSGHRYDLDLFDAHGTMNRAVLAEMREFLACHKTGKHHPIHWRLLTLLQAIGSHWPGRTIIVHSGYRHPSVSHHARRSNHTRGRAIDIRVENVGNRELVETLARSFTHIGIGYYPNSQFVHLDIREQPRFWIDYAGPGQQSCYSPTPWDDLLDGQADRLGYRKAKTRGCKGHRIAQAQNPFPPKPSPPAQSAKALSSQLEE